MSDDHGRYSVISLFSGSLGLDIGLARTGRFHHLACVEMDAAACETIRVNRDAGRIDPSRLYEADIVRLDPRRVMRDLGLRAGDLDCLVGGPPCQSYSYAGGRGGVKDARGLMLWQMLWFIEAFRPRCWILENVAGLLSAKLTDADKKGSLLKWLIDDLPNEYRVDLYKVNAVNHGVPQVRSRVFLFGNRLDRVARFPPPTHGPRLLPYRTLRDALRGFQDPRPEVIDFTRRRKRYLALVPPGGNWRDLPEEIAREAMGKAHQGKGGQAGFYRRLAWDEPCPTVLAAPNQIMTSMCHPDETRALSLAECAAVQQYPPDWAFCGGVADKYRQVGNGVPVRLGELAGEVAAKLLDSEEAVVTERPRCNVVDLGSTVRFARAKC